MINRENLELTSEYWGCPDIEVGMGEWAEARRGEVIKTGGLGPCVGVAIFDPNQRVGYIAHTIGPEIDTIESLFKELVIKAKNTSKLKAWVTGGYTIENEEYYPEFRDDVCKMFAEFGITQKNLEIKWVENDGQYANLTLDCRTGEGKIEIDNIKDEDDEFGF